MEGIKSNNYQNFMIFFTFFLFWISIQFGEVVEDFLAYVLVISIGIIHGANDLLILSVKDKKNKSFIKNLFIYVSIILACILIYIISPFIAILLFVLLSAYHFGEEHFGDKIKMNTLFNSIFFLAYGLFIFSLLFYQSLLDVDKIMAELTGTSFSKVQVEVTLIVSAILLFLGSSYLIVIKKSDLKMFLKELFYLVLLFLVFNTSSLILGFAIYFIFWHSIPSIIHQVEFISGNLNKKNILFYVKKAMVYWVISIAGLLILYQLVPKIELFASVVFVILFAVTAPHTWVMHKMKN
ncbi:MULTISPECIES: Brp/Blh family beta-carotene 15,15'-dioxygenase [unclassified Polaribacter]|uniref:Brp/Blh family beta-carotene 15,15'-dioxygenase n=1 Tax=unclassified Polaribacter TaxID=196858 RepID=UPI0011BE1324|nr:MULTISPECIES: Brp/Blh family beta-carotene 15,15'-dioxygenase [unclassified Polaribacter]TXD54393.1 beta-carotene 15,15'-dioxygenase [Polaribacter sp. IC063]TXD62776.1 beta-carotene 15,15'-dioxygenase [Polaribacter sp. IC066]